MRDRGPDYLENSRRATYVQRQYAIRTRKHSGATMRIVGGLPQAMAAPAVNVQRLLWSRSGAPWCWMIENYGRGWYGG
jgi:hypothetical protein